MKQRGPRGRGKRGKGNNGNGIPKHASVVENRGIRKRNVGAGRKNAKHVGKRGTSNGFVGIPIQNHRSQKGKGRGIRGEQKGGRDQTNQKKTPLPKPTKNHGVARVEQ